MHTGINLIRRLLFLGYSKLVGWRMGQGWFARSCAQGVSTHFVILLIKEMEMA